MIQSAETLSRLILNILRDVNHKIINLTEKLTAQLARAVSSAKFFGNGTNNISRCFYSFALKYRPIAIIRCFRLARDIYLDGRQESSRCCR